MFIVVKFTPKYSILFDAGMNGTDFFILFSNCSLQVYKNSSFYILILVSCNLDNLNSFNFFPYKRAYLLQIEIVLLLQSGYHLFLVLVQISWLASPFSNEKKRQESYNDTDA